MARERTKNLSIRVDDEELAMAQKLADATDESIARLTRRLFREAFAAKFGDAAPQSKR